ADAGGVLGVGDVPDVVQPVLHRPVALDPGGQGRGVDVGGGDHVDDLNGGLAPDGDGAAQLGDQGGAGEGDPRRDVRGLDGAPYPAALGLLEVAVGRDVLPWQGFQPSPQGGAVALDGEHVVAAGADDELGGV